MNEKQVKQRLYGKLHTEYLSYQKDICGRPSEEVFEKAFEISSMQEIYGNLLDSVPTMDMASAEQLLAVQDILSCLYQEWLKTEDLLRVTAVTEKFLKEMDKDAERRMAG